MEYWVEEKISAELLEFTVIYNVINLQARGKMQRLPNYVFTVQNTLKVEH